MSKRSQQFPVVVYLFSGNVLFVQTAKSTFHFSDLSKYVLGRVHMKLLINICICLVYLGLILAVWFLCSLYILLRSYLHFLYPGIM
jgi:hypothetical protein